jgi:hypothetical protein
LSLPLLVVSITSLSVANADGGEIAYIANDHGSIHVVQSDGTNDRQVVAAPNLDYLTWSPDGKRLVYTTHGTGGAIVPIIRHRIFLFDISTQHSAELKSSTDTYGPIAFFPDGRRLAALSLGTTGDRTPANGCYGPVVSIDVATGAATQLANAGCTVSGLQVAPDGAALLATACVDATCGVWNIALPSGESNLVGDPTATDAVALNNVAVSVDNQAIAYVGIFGADSSVPGELVIADRDGSNPRRVLQGRLVSVGFSPDSSQVVASMVRSVLGDAPEDIWVVDTTGDNAHQIAAGHAPALRPQPQDSATSAQQTPESPAPNEAQDTNARAATPAAPSDIGGRTTRLCQPVGAPNALRWECGDANGYIFNFQANTVSLYAVSNPSHILEGPIHIVSMGAASGSWVDSSGRQCAYQLVDPYFKNKQINVTCGL